MGCKNVNIDNIMEVCRLCLGTDNLISVFDNRIKIPENMIDVIQITSGVTVTADDNISQKLCNKCLHITIKMFKFRSSSIVNDMELKAMAAGKLKVYTNESVDHLLQMYPRIKLPGSITKCNISPVVSINKNEVIKWMEVYKKKRKIEKKRRKELRAAKKRLDSEKIMMDLELENEFIDHFVADIDISSELTSVPSSESVVTSLQLLTPEASPVMPDITEEVDEEHDLKSQQEITVSNEVTEECTIVNNLDDTYKRKLSSSSNSPESKKLKSDINLVEGEDSVDSLVTLKYVNKSLLICDICNGILYSAKDLKKHKMNHMRCNLCRKSYHSMEETKEHCENGCPMKQIMNNLPIINLKRCDNSKELREQYPLAFGIKPDEVLKSDILNPPAAKESSLKSEEIVEDTPKVEKTIIKPTLPSSESTSHTVPIEILLISDDEDEEDQSLVKKDDSSSNQNAKPTANNTESKKTQVSTSKNDKTICISHKNASKIVNSKKIDNETVKLTTGSSTVRPNIEIVGENVIDVNLDDDDISLLKNLLKRTKHHNKETSVQTDIPCNADILPTANKDKLFELKNLRNFLNFYKIPVNISYASQYSLRYGNDPSPLLKKDRSWSKVNTKVPKPATNVISGPTTKPAEDSHSATLSKSNICTPASSNSSTISKSNISTPMSTPSAVGTPTILPQLLLANVQNGAIPKDVTSLPPTSVINPSSLVKNVILSTKAPCIPTTTMSSPVYQKVHPKAPTLTSSNSPLVLNYNLQNLNYPTNMSNTSWLTQTVSSQVPQKNFTILNNNNINNMLNVVPSRSGQYSVTPQSSSHNVTPLSFYRSEPSTKGIPIVPVVNSMPPPLSTFIPHRTSVLKINSNAMIPNSAPPQSKSGSYNSIPVSNPTCDQSSKFVPTIRVRNVSELR